MNWYSQIFKLNYRNIQYSGNKSRMEISFPSGFSQGGMKYLEISLKARLLSVQKCRIHPNQLLLLTDIIAHQTVCSFIFCIGRPVQY